MALTLEQIRTTLTRDEVLEDMLATLQSLGFNTTAWQSGGVVRTLLTSFATIESARTLAVDALSRFIFLQDSTESALTALASSHYDVTRIAATNTTGDVVLTGGAVGPPHVVAAGDVVVATADGTTFRNVTGGTVPASGSVTLSFQAEVAGTDGNVANLAINTLQTALAGTTVSNPDPGSGTWITTAGTDEETDAALQTRCRAKWGVISVSDPEDRYEYFVRTAVTNAPRVFVASDNPRGAGTLDVYTASATGVSAAADVALAQVELDRIRNPTADVLAKAAPAQPQAFVFQCWVDTASNTAATQAAIEQALTDYTNSLDIGGTVFPDALQGKWVLSEALDAMTSISGVRRVNMTTPSTDVSISGNTVMTVDSISGTYTSI